MGVPKPVVMWSDKWMFNSQGTISFSKLLLQLFVLAIVYKAKPSIVPVNLFYRRITLGMIG